MEISCDEVILELSSYVDRDLDRDLYRDIESHLAKCHDCTVILDGVRNVVALFSDERLFTLPAGFSTRLREKLLSHR